MASEYSVGFEPADRLAEDRESVRRRFWLKFKRVVAKLPFAEDLLAAYYCAFDKQTPRHVDAAVLATAIRLVASHIRDDHREAARAALKRGIEDEG